VLNYNVKLLRNSLFDALLLIQVNSRGIVGLLQVNVTKNSVNLLLEQGSGFDHI